MKLNSYIFICITTLFVISDSLLSQESEKKSKIIFNDSKSVSASDSGIVDQKRPKIIFTGNLKNDSRRIELITDDKFSVGINTLAVGDEGDNLKSAMGNDLESIRKVDEAFSNKRMGKTLMILGAIVGVVGVVATSTWVKTHEETNGNVRYNYYWIPGITLGLIAGGIGYVKFNSFHGDLVKAVENYNSGL